MNLHGITHHNYAINMGILNFVNKFFVKLQEESKKQVAT